MKKLLSFVLIFTMVFAFAGTVFAAPEKTNGYVEATETYGATASASVEKLNGNQNGLTITVAVDGIFAASEYFLIANNSAGEFTVGGYKVYVSTYGNTKIDYCFITYAPAPQSSSYLVRFYALDGVTLVHQQQVTAGGYIEGGNPELYNSWSTPDALAANYKLPENWVTVPGVLQDLDTGAEFNWKETPVFKDLNVTIAVIKYHRVTFYALDEETVVCSQLVLDGKLIEGGDWDLYNSWSTPEALAENYGLKEYQKVIPGMLKEIGTDNVFNWKETPIAKDINVTIAIEEEIPEWVVTVVPPTCTLQGYTERHHIPTGGKWYENYVPALGHLYDEDDTVKDDGYGFYFACGRCEWAGYLYFDDGSIISSANGDELVKRITDAEIDLDTAVVNEGYLNSVLVTFYITEYYKNDTTEDIEYVHQFARNGSGFRDVGRYVLEYEVVDGVLVKLEISKINYYSHG